MLGLYRQLLRALRSKDADTMILGSSHARAEFERHRGVKHSNILLIEHLLRGGRKQLALLQQPGTRVTAMPKSPEGRGAAGRP